MIRSKVSVFALAIAMGSTATAIAQDATDEEQAELRRMDTGTTATDEDRAELRRMDTDTTATDEERAELRRMDTGTTATDEDRAELRRMDTGTTATDEDRAELRRMDTDTTATDEERAELRRVGPESDEDTKVEDRITVTGSRIKGANPTSRVDVISREDLQGMAATNLQEVLDQLPQNLSNLNSLNSLDQARGGGTLLPDQGDLGSNINALGVSAANLGGVGVGSTLVLVDGRRQPGAAGIEDGFVNINNIPLASIERVEIIYDGASAVYGADAIGGVINIITRKDYQGWSISAERDFGDAGGDNESFSVYHGRNWESGRFSITGSYRKSEPINAPDSGWTTNDYSNVVLAQDGDGNDIFGVNRTPELIPGGLVQFSRFGQPFAGGTIPSGFDFANAAWTQDSFAPVTEADFYAGVPEFLGQETTQKSINVNFEQDITKDIRLFVSGSFTDTENIAPAEQGSIGFLQLAPSNFYGPSAQEKFDNITTSADGFLTQDYLVLDVVPQYAYDAGYLPLDTRSTENETWSYSIGFDWDLFDDKWLLEADYTYGEANQDGFSKRLGQIVRTNTDFNFGAGTRTYDSCSAVGGFSGGTVDSLVRIENQAAGEAQCLAITSSDPNIAFNPWATSPDDPGAITPDNVNTWYLPVFQDPTSSANEQLTVNLQGAVYELPAGAVFASLGAELREQETFSTRIVEQVGVTPVNKTTAFFGELSIPVFGGDFTRPGFETLLLSLQMRNDEQTTKGAIGTVDDIPFEDGGEPIIREGKAEATTTTLSFMWEPVKTLTVRGGWTQGFNPVNISAQFDVEADNTDLVRTQRSITGDPFVEGFDVDNPAPRYRAVSYTVPNPDLEPSESDTYSLGVTWEPEGVLDGLRTSVNYRTTEVRNSQLDSFSLGDYTTPEEFFSNTLLFEREPFLREAPTFTQPGGAITSTPNDDNLITRVNNLTINIPGRTTESIEYFVSYDFDTSFGDWRAELTYLDNLKSDLEVTEGRVFSNLGFLSGPDDYRIAGSINYTNDKFSARLSGQYYPSYINDSFLRVRSGEFINSSRSFVQEVDESYYFDLTGAYQVTERVRIGGGVTNLLDQDPPFTLVNNDGRPYDVGRYNPRGRVVSINGTYEF